MYHVSLDDVIWLKVLTFSFSFVVAMYIVAQGAVLHASIELGCPLGDINAKRVSLEAFNSVFEGSRPEVFD